MKKSPWLILAVCALLVGSSLLGACQSKGVVVAKVGKTNITQKDVDVFANFILLSNGATRADITSADDMKTLMNNALDASVTYELLSQKGQAMGLTPLSEQDQQSVTDQVSSYTQQLTPQSGLTAQDLNKLFTQFQVANLIEAQVNKDVSVTDADIQSKYDELSQQQKQSFDADASAYESSKSAGDTIVYVPAGFRYVKHILIAFSDTDASAISTARSNGDDAGANKLRDDALVKIKPKADEVMAKVKSGEDFDKLMADYGQDPGMQTDPEKTTGYEIGSSSSFVQEFKDAAMKLAKVGDVSDLVATDFGYHIIKYIGDVTPGAVPLDTVKDALQQTALTDKQNTNMDNTIAQWKTDAKVVTYPDKLNIVLTTPAPGATTAAAPELTPAATAPAETAAPAAS